MNKIGFMQGRLSPLVNNKIQSFPFKSWLEEFPMAQKLGISLMEWTLDYPKLHQNPLLLKEYKRKILDLSEENNITISSITLDCCMQRPFWKAQDELVLETLINDFKLIINAANSIGARILVIPLVDNGSIDNEKEYKLLKNNLLSLSEILKEKKIKIAFESDFYPTKLKNFISNFDEKLFGINYDSGNSASLGFNPDEEFNEYGERIINIHIKDRKLGGSTVRLGQGDTDFNKVFKNIDKYNYEGNLILQTARSKDDEHFKELAMNFAFVKENISKFKSKTMNK